MKTTVRNEENASWNYIRQIVLMEKHACFIRAHTACSTVMFLTRQIAPASALQRKGRDACSCQCKLKLFTTPKSTLCSAAAQLSHGHTSLLSPSSMTLRKAKSLA